MTSSNKVILALYQGTLSLGQDKVLFGKESVALAAHSLCANYPTQTLVRKYTPRPRGYNPGKLYKLVGYEILDQEKLMEWWYESN